MSVIHVSTADFQSEVLESAGTVLVDFWAPWCGPCRMIAPVLEEIAAEQPSVKVCKVNVDDEQELAIQYGVSSIPTLLVFRDGQPVRQTVGAMPKEKLLALLGL